MATSVPGIFRGIIHMNGRIYEPRLGRMLSPDPVTQAPENGQNYNRYTYAYNNPLKYSDPSGYTAHIQRPWEPYGGPNVIGMSGQSSNQQSYNVEGGVVIVAHLPSPPVVGNQAALEFSVGGVGNNSPQIASGDSQIEKSGSQKPAEEPVAGEEKPQAGQCVATDNSGNCKAWYFEEEQSCSGGPVSCIANGTQGLTYTDEDGRKWAEYTCVNEGGTCIFPAPGKGEHILGAESFGESWTETYGQTWWVKEFGWFDVNPGNLWHHFKYGSGFIDALRRAQEAKRDTR